MMSHLPVRGAIDCPARRRNLASTWVGSLFGRRFRVAVWSSHPRKVASRTTDGRWALAERANTLPRE